jgi:hypothetical protein
MNHKRKRARNRRAGCKLCKPWKVNGVRTESADGEKFSDHRRRTADAEAVYSEAYGRATEILRGRKLPSAHLSEQDLRDLQDHPHF